MNVPHVGQSPLPYSREALRTGIYLSHQIVLVAAPGRGKSTLRQKLAASFTPNLTCVSGGQFMRQRAREFGFGDDITRFAKHMKAHPEEGHDEWCDGQMSAFSRLNGHIIDTHLPCFFPFGFLVKLKCDSAECALRLAKKDGKGDDPVAVAEIKSVLDSRDSDDDTKYAHIYPGSLWLETDYDYVIDTETHGAEDCFNRVKQAYEDWLHVNRHVIITDPVLRPKMVLAG